MLLEKGKKILFKICRLDPSRPVVAGISGGADSIAMLDMLVKLDFKVCVAHLNHQLRPTALRDEEFVRNIAESRDLECFSRKVAVKQLAKDSGEGIEEAARNARYRFLFEVADQKKATAVLVAHHADDQVETILQSILRGAGLKGLAGMQFQTLSTYHTQIPLVRPLLECWREEVLEYCSLNNLQFMTDETNEDTAYRRNRIRLELIPYLQTYNPQIKDALQRMGKIVGTDKDFADAYLQNIMAGNAVSLEKKEAKVNINDFKQMDVAVQRMVVKHILERSFPDENELGFSQFEDARRFINREIKSTGIQINDRIILRKEKDQAVFLMSEILENPVPEWPSIDKPIQHKLESGSIVLSRDWKMELDIHSVEEIGKSYLENEDLLKVYLDAETLGMFIEIRAWQAGDRYQPMGMNGQSIKVSDFWINKKIPERAKKHWPLIFSSGKLVWIPGFQPSESAKVTAKTRQIVFLRVYSD